MKIGAKSEDKLGSFGKEAEHLGKKSLFHGLHAFYIILSG